MDRERFDELVARAVESLPEEFAGRLDNVAIIVEDYPTPARLRRTRTGRDSTLLGLYEGVPRTHRGSNYGMVLPDKITIFQQPIEERCRSEAQVVALVRRVVLHEIAHHFGISDAWLAELERDSG